MIEDTIYCKDFYGPTMKYKISAGVTEEEWRVLNLNATGMIHLYINSDIFQQVANETKACEMWRKLESLFGRKILVNKAMVIKHL